MCLLLDEALALRSSRLKRVYQAGITAGESRASSSVLVPEVNLVISTWRAARKFWLGPFVRYLDVLQPNHLDLDNRASSTLFAGLTFEVLLNR